jgi:hypothetical protein
MKLEGITTEGKNELKEQGDEWILEERWAKVGFSQVPGPWGLMRSVATGNKRWIHLKRDEDFKVMTKG